MSINSAANRFAGDIRRAIGEIARQELCGVDGVVVGTKKIQGYVCAINETGDLAGTVDVQEYGYEPDGYTAVGAGHHKGVYLSAIQDNGSGMFVVPMMFSDVVIVRNPVDGREYVLMYSHAKRVKMTARSLKGKNDGQVEIGVAEVEAFVSDSDGLDKDYDELEPTKNATGTLYTAKSITDSITSSDGSSGFKQEKTAGRKVIAVGDTKVTIDGSNVVIETSGKISLTVGGVAITEEGGVVKVEADSCQVKGSDIKIDGGNVTVTGGTLNTKGVSSADLNGPFNAIKVCPFSGAPHCGSSVSGT